MAQVKQDKVCMHTVAPLLIYMATFPNECLSRQ